MAITTLTSTSSSSSSSEQFLTAAAAHGANSVPLLHRSEHTAAVTYVQRQQTVTRAGVTRGNGSALNALQQTSSSSSNSSSREQAQRLPTATGESLSNVAGVGSDVASWNCRLARMSSTELNTVLIKSLPACSEWPQPPLFVRLSPLVPNQVHSNLNSHIVTLR
jgi:hypothetical protein